MSELKLTDNERMVLSERILRRMNDRATLQSLGDKVGLSRNRISQIERKVMKKVRKAFMGVGLQSLAIDPVSYINAKSLQRLAKNETGLALRISSAPGHPVILVRDHWKLLFQPVSMLGGSVRTVNCFQNAQITTVLDLCTRTEAEMLKSKNFGRKSLKETKEKLAELGLGLGSCLCWFEAGRVERDLTGKEERSLEEYIKLAEDEFNGQVAA